MIRSLPVKAKGFQVFFDMSLPDIVTLAVLAIVLFGPDRLPELVQNAVAVIRKVRELSESAKQEIRSELGPEFQDFEFEDLHPKAFVRKHVLDGAGLDEMRGALDPRAEFAEAADAVRGSASEIRSGAAHQGRVRLTEGEQPAPVARPAFDPDTT